MSADRHDAPARESALTALRVAVAKISATPLDEPAQILVDALMRKFPGAAVLFYGSGASVSRLENPTDIIFDFYVIGPSYEALYASRTLRTANRLIPPNVFYFETPSPFGTLRAKYAVLSLDHFEKLVGAATFHSYFWARFAQPCRIHAPDNAMKARLEDALARAIATFCGASAGLTDGAFRPLDLWLAGLGASYRAELRAEDSERAAKLIESYGTWAETVTAPALTLAGYEPRTNDSVIMLNKKPRDARLAWRLRAAAGAGLSVLRLLKGTQTFNGGIDYIAWKIKRHSGVDIEVTDWERRHPMLGAPGAALRYYRLRAQQKRNPGAR
jgi:hypothetical protein